MSLFQKIHDLIEDHDCLVTILIDEVESLTAARQAAMANSEPSDAIRVVNAILTQIDKLRMCKNTLILTTSNITGAIDLAFLDRVDMRCYIGEPGVMARFDILRSCIMELSRIGIVDTEEIETSQVLLKETAASKLLEVCKKANVLFIVFETYFARELVVVICGNCQFKHMHSSLQYCQCDILLII